jgi:uncharacterized protein involved in propanediol utilization
LGEVDRHVATGMSMTLGIVGLGCAEQHHGELLQGGLWRAGELVPCLITMPGRGVGSTARFRAAGPVGSSGSLEVVPAWKQKAARAARLTLEFIGAPVAGRLEIECSVATGVGLGSSTCDVVAAIRAVAAAYGASLDAATVARLAIEAEDASDPIMFDREMVLFAQRQGRVLESFGSWIPQYAVMSFDADPSAGGVETLSLPVPAYTSVELAGFESMVARAREAFRRHDPGALATLAAVATESATLNQRFLPLRNFAGLRRVADEFGALGLQISHSGTIGGLLFAEGVARVDVTLETRLTARLRSLGARPLGLFTTGAEPTIDDTGMTS